MKIRSITIFGTREAVTQENTLKTLSDFAKMAKESYESTGIEVQTIRLATDGYVYTQDNNIVKSAVNFEALCQEYGFDYISLGPVPEMYLSLVPKILAETDSTFMTTEIVNTDKTTINGNVIHQVAQVIQEAARIEDGFGNLRFAALANVPAHTPFFPAAYHDGEKPAFAIAMEAADLAVTACSRAADVNAARASLTQIIEAKGQQITKIAAELAQAHTMRFEGIDFSLAPYPKLNISIGAALEALSGYPLGTPGTLAAAATLTTTIDQADFPHAGFCGLMLPVLEDVVLAQRAAEGTYGISDLLQWSAVCGTGLDTVPLPGNASAASITQLLFDIAALSVRLQKPLTARLMPLPGKVAGDATHFDFDFFADGGVLALGEAKDGKLGKTEKLELVERENVRREGVNSFHLGRC